MAGQERSHLIGRVAARWLLNHEQPPQARAWAHLPVGMVASLELGDRVRGMDRVDYEVSAVGPGALVLSVGDRDRVFTNKGYGSYAWAYFAAPELHWLINR